MDINQLSKEISKEGVIYYSLPTFNRIYNPLVSLVIPTLNEEKNLPLVLPLIPTNLVDEVILVDGRSSDATVKTARTLMPSIKVIFEKKRGKGAAMLAGYKASRGDIIIVMDADGSHDPRWIPRERDIVEAPASRSAMAVPVVSAGRLSAVMTLARKSLDFTEEEMNLVCSLMPAI